MTNSQKSPDQDIINHLAYYSSKSGRTLLGLSWILPLILLLMAANNFYQVYLTNQALGGAFSDLLLTWIGGVNTYGTYTGHYVSAIQLIGSGLINLSVGMAGFLGGYFYRKQGKVNSRILQLITDKVN